MALKSARSLRVGNDFCCQRGLRVLFLPSASPGMTFGSPPRREKLQMKRVGDLERRESACFV